MGRRSVISQFVCGKRHKKQFMYVFTCFFIYVCINTYVHLNRSRKYCMFESIYAYMDTYLRAYALTSMFMHTHTRIETEVENTACINLCTDIFIHICMCAYILMCTYTYVHVNRSGKNSWHRGRLQRMGLVYFNMCACVCLFVYV